jgi:hypothetical protein
MSVPARYENGVFRPLEDVKGAANGEVNSLSLSLVFRASASPGIE